MISLRKYGNPPFTVALLHGGPGAAGSMEPVARGLSKQWGVLEPIQNEKSVDGQVKELRKVLAENASGPVVMMGHSWGAWLGFILAAKHGALVKKLILVSAGPFEEKYVGRISENRLKRLNSSERTEYLELVERLNNRDLPDNDKPLSRLGGLSAKADNYEILSDPVPVTPTEQLTASPGEIYARVWPEAAAMRRSGELLRLGETIRCPVLAIQGKCDPHPAEGVAEPLSRVISDFRMVILDKCGHTPWRERHAAQRFYEIINGEMGTAPAVVK